MRNGRTPLAEKGKAQDSALQPQPTWTLPTFRCGCTGHCTISMALSLLSLAAGLTTDLTCISSAWPPQGLNYIYPFTSGEVR